MNGFCLSVSDWLQLSYLCLTALSITVTAWVALWVAQKVQRQIDTDKTLRNHFANEITEVRSETRKLIELLISEKTISAVEMKRKHYSLQLHINDLLRFLNQRYSIDKKNYLKAYRSTILALLEKAPNYIANYSSATPISLADSTKKELHSLSLKNDHLFNEILLKLYERID